KALRRATSLHEVALGDLDLERRDAAVAITSDAHRRAATVQQAEIHGRAHGRLDLVDRLAVQAELEQRESQRAATGQRGLELQTIFEVGEDLHRVAAARVVDRIREAAVEPTAADHRSLGLE